MGSTVGFGTLKESDGVKGRDGGWRGGGEWEVKGGGRGGGGKGEGWEEGKVRGGGG